MAQVHETSSTVTLDNLFDSVDHNVPGSQSPPETDAQPGTTARQIADQIVSIDVPPTVTRTEETDVVSVGADVVTDDTEPGSQPRFRKLEYSEIGSIYRKIAAGLGAYSVGVLALDFANTGDRLIDPKWTIPAVFGVSTATSKIVADKIINRWSNQDEIDDTAEGTEGAADTTDGSEGAPESDDTLKTTRRSLKEWTADTLTEKRLRMAQYGMFATSAVAFAADNLHSGDNVFWDAKWAVPAAAGVALKIARNVKSKTDEASIGVLARMQSFGVSAIDKAKNVAYSTGMTREKADGSGREMTRRGKIAFVVVGTVAAALVANKCGMFGLGGGSGGQTHDVARGAVAGGAKKSSSAARAAQETTTTVPAGAGGSAAVAAASEAATKADESLRWYNGLTPQGQSNFGEMMTWFHEQSARTGKSPEELASGFDKFLRGAENAGIK